MISVEHYLAVAAVLFVIGIFGIFLNRKNVIVILMSIELMLVGCEHQPCGVFQLLGDLAGQSIYLVRPDRRRRRGRDWAWRFWFASSATVARLR